MLGKDRSRITDRLRLHRRPRAAPKAAGTATGRALAVAQVDLRVEVHRTLVKANSNFRRNLSSRHFPNVLEKTHPVFSEFSIENVAFQY